MTNTEIWKDIEGYEGKYQISNFGRVKSLPRKYSPKEKILKPSNNRCGKSGYLFCPIRCNGVKTNIWCHIEVAKYFIGERPPNKVVHHKDGNSLNNNVENLEYITSRENVSLSEKYKDRLTGTFKRKNGRFTSIIINKGKRICLGTYDTELEAHLAYKNKLKSIEESEYNKLV